jgi:signal transduction histidine kinase
MRSEPTQSRATSDAGLRSSHSPDQPRLLVPVLSVGMLALSCMLLFEVVKELFFPALSKWESHFVTIGFSTLSTMVASVFVLQHQRALHWRALLERERAAAERRAFERNLLETQRRESLGVLAGGIAHDFNNLLTTIVGNAELALLDLDPRLAPAKSIEQIISASRRATALTQQILAYAGKRRVLAGPVNLNAIVANTILLVRPAIARQIAIDEQVAAAMLTIEADARQLGQVVMNLLINAAEAIGEQAGQIVVRTGTRFASQEYLASTQLGAGLVEGSYLFVEVVDTGCGMDAATKAKIFEPFFTTKFTGRGLGLAAVLGIVRSHRGAIAVQSTPGQGSSFTILFPALTFPRSAAILGDKKVDSTGKMMRYSVEQIEQRDTPGRWSG